MEARYKAIVLGGSAGSFQPVTKILASLNKSFPVPIFLCLHRLKHVRHGFVETLSIKSEKKIKEPIDKEIIEAGMVYLSPANYHMGIDTGGRISLSTEPVYNNSRPSIDFMFSSSAEFYGNSLTSILLSGANRDGALGTKSVKDLGGLTIVQDPEESMINTMPKSALELTEIDKILTVAQIIDFINKDILIAD